MLSSCFKMPPSLTYTCSSLAFIKVIGIDAEAHGGSPWAQLLPDKATTQLHQWPKPPTVLVLEALPQALHVASASQLQHLAGKVSQVADDGQVFLWADEANGLEAIVAPDLLGSSNISWSRTTCMFGKALVVAKMHCQQRTSTHLLCSRWPDCGPATPARQASECRGQIRTDKASPPKGIMHEIGMQA